MKGNHEAPDSKEHHFAEFGRAGRRSNNSIEKMLRLQYKMKEFFLTYTIRRPDK